MKFTDIPRAICYGNYEISVSWDFLLEWIDSKVNCSIANCKLNIDPDFQRRHVWTDDNQIAFVEYALKGAATQAGTNILRFNCPGWMGTYLGPFELVDGKQRLTSVIRFLSNEIPAYGVYFKDFEDRLPNDVEFKIRINNLNTRAEVLRWYLEINSCGIVHSASEIARVKLLFDLELTNEKPPILDFRPS